MTKVSSRVSPSLLIAGFVGLAVFARFHRSASPHADVPLRVTRAAAIDTARHFLTAEGARLGELEQAVQFSGNTVHLVFLQRTLGLTEASHWARNLVPIWSWQLRWFKPLQKEEWQVRVAVDGGVAGFAHLVPEAAPGANLPQDSALAVAETFLRGRGWSLADFDRVEASSEKRDKRTDHHFTWEKKGTTVSWRGAAGDSGTGAVRLSVEVQGDRVGGYRRFLKVPEAFERQLTKTLSVGLVIAFASGGVSFALFLIAVGLSIVRYRRGDVQWRPALRLGGLIAVLFIAQGLSTYPHVKFSYPTASPWGVFLVSLALGLLFAAVVYGCWVVFTLAAGESLG